MNLYLKELKYYRWSLLFWSLAIIGFMIAAMSKYEGFSKSGTTINDLINSMPAGLSAVLGFSGLDIQAAGGFYAMSVLYLAVLLGVHAVLLGSRIIAKEETDKTIEFLFAKPVTRNRILFVKLLAALTEIVVLLLITLIASIFTVAAFNEGPSINGDILFLTPSIFFIQIWFLIIGTAFACIMRHPKPSTLYAATLLLAVFIISAFVDLTEKLDFLKYFTPFKYFDARTIYLNGSYSVLYIAITLAATVVLLTVSMLAYQRRDFDI